MSSTFRPWRFEQPRHGEHRADAHFVGLAAGDGPARERAQRLQAAAFGFLGFHQHHGGGAVGELAGVAGGDELAGALHRLELGEALERGVGAIALVAIDHVVDDAFFLRLLVDHLHLGLHRDDLVPELAGLLGGGHAALRFQRIFVLVFAAELVALGDDVGGVDHRHPEIGIHLGQPRLFPAAAAALIGDGLDAAPTTTLAPSSMM